MAGRILDMERAQARRGPHRLCQFSPSGAPHLPESDSRSVPAAISRQLPETLRSRTTPLASTFRQDA